MKKWISILGVAGAIWMTLVLYSGRPFLALVTNYPGVFATRWVHYRGVAPSSSVIWLVNIWLVFTSAVEWVVVGLFARAISQRLSG